MQTVTKRRMLGLCRHCGKPATPGMASCEQCRERIREAYKENPTPQWEGRKKYETKLRDECLAAYGGKCITCGYDNPAGLLIHHGNHDGGKKRQEEGIGRGRTFYKKLRNDGYPQDLGLEVMCGTCHLIHHRG